MTLKAFFIYGFLHRIVSTNTLSRIVGRLANRNINKHLLRFVIKRYINFFKIDMEEYDLDLTKVENFNTFFTRKLKEDSRTWGKGICSPVDGKVLSFGTIEKDMLFQVKGKDYAASELTGESGRVEGSFINLYLSPANYHRVHAPFDMKIEQIRHIPGKLLSVSKKNATTVDKLYLKNERVIISGNSVYGRFHFVFVGATNVGSIRLSCFPEFRSNIKNSRLTEWFVDKEVRKSDELGLFEMGSTIIMILSSTDLEKCKSELLDNAVLLGQELLD